jgi:hypothetical protein
LEKIRISLLIFILAGLTLFSFKDFFSSPKDLKFLSFAPTPYPALSENRNYDVTKVINESSQISGNIEVTSPIKNDAVNSSFIVKGNARIKDNIVYMRLSDATGNILFETSTQVYSSSEYNFGPFEKLIFYKSESGTGVLDIFQLNTNDGTLKDMVKIPLIFN